MLRGWILITSLAVRAALATEPEPPHHWICLASANRGHIGHAFDPTVRGAVVAVYAEGARPRRSEPQLIATTGRDGCATLELSALGPEASRLYVSADGYASTWAPLEVHDRRAVHGLRDTRWVDWVLIHSGIATTVTEVGTTIGRRSLDALPLRR